MRTIDRTVAGASETGTDWETRATSHEIDETVELARAARIDEIGLVIATAIAIETFTDVEYRGGWFANRQTSCLKVTDAHIFFPLLPGTTV
jgi:hypothetical protein